MSKWIFDNEDDITFTMDYNPSRDTDFQADPRIVEIEMLGNKQTVLQVNGFRSRPRKVEGITKSEAIKQALDDLKETLGVFKLTDHRGKKRPCIIRSLEWDELQDATNVGHTFKYTMVIWRRTDVNP